MRKSLKTRDKQIARSLARRMELEAYGVEQRLCSWEDLSTEVLALPNLKHRTRAKYRFVLRRFGGFLISPRSRSVTSISPADIGRYIEERATDVHPTRSICVGREGLKSDLRILKRAFSIAVDRGYIPSNPVRVSNLNTLPGKTMPFSREEVDTMLARAGGQLRCILLVFLTTGLRISDVIDLRKDCVDMKSGWITVRTQKRGKTVSLPIHDALSGCLSQLPKTQSPLLFPTKTGRPMTSLRAYLYRLWNRCGIAGGHPHRFRDTFACRLLENGASLYDVAKLLGITVQTAERHYSPYVRELRERGKRLVSFLDVSP